MPTKSIRAVAPVLLAVVGLAGGCSGDRGAGDPAAAAERAQERERKAAFLYDQATRATVPEKVRILGRLLAAYPETEVVPKAYFQLVQYLLDKIVDRPEEALERARAFATRHPRILLWSECFRLIDRHAVATGRGDAWIRRVHDAWGEALSGLEGREQELEPNLRVRLVYDRAELAGRRGDRDGAMRLFARAAEIPAENKFLVKDALMRLGTLQADEGLREEARATFDRLLDLIRAGHERGQSEEDVLAELEKLDG